MAARITPLRLEAFEQLPKHARRCVYWEVDPLTVGAEGHLSDPEFEKEAWLSMVMLVVAVREELQVIPAIVLVIYQVRGHSHARNGVCTMVCTHSAPLTLHHSRLASL